MNQWRTAAAMVTWIFIYTIISIFIDTLIIQIFVTTTLIL